MDSKTTAPTVTGLRARVGARLDATGQRQRWTLIAALVGMFANGFPFTILAVSLGEVARELGTDETTIAWVITTPMLFSAVALPMLGKLGDLKGHRRVFLFGSTSAAIIAATTGLAWSVGSLIALRTLASVLGGATGPSSMALIFRVIPPVERTRAMGWWSMTGAGAPAVGLIAGGPLVDLVGWRSVFLLQALFAFCALLLAWLVLPETPPKRVRFDVPGALTLAIGVGGLLFGVSQLRGARLSDPKIWAPMMLGALGLLAFLAIERRAAEPLLPLEFFTRRNFTAPIVTMSFMGAAYMGAFVLAPLVLQQVFGLTVSAAAGLMLLRTLTLSLSSPLGGLLGARRGERFAAFTGTFMIAASMLLLASGTENGWLVLVGVGLVFQGLGQGLCLPSLNSVVAGAVPADDLGIATGASRLTNQIGTAIGIALVTMAYGGDPDGFDRGFLLGAVFAAVSAIGSLFVLPHRAVASANIDPKEGTES
ncbi:MAG: MFS transporter [Acidobacteriota bacterium]